MKLITAIIKPEKLDEVTRAVRAVGARGMTITEVHGFGQQYGNLAAVRQVDADVLVLPKLRIEVIVHDQMALAVTEAIAKSVYTGEIGDGKIWVCPVESVLRVRSGEHDKDAI